MEQAMFVTAARIAAHLYFATQIAKDLSLTAKNARAITARAGQQAAGFTALTTFIQELADKTIKLAQQVNEVAIQISMCATDLERVQHANKEFIRVKAIGHDALYINSIDNCILRSQQHLQTVSQHFMALRYQLNALVEDTRKQIRFAAVISTMSKVEASNSGVFESQLDVIAANILLAGNDIRKELESAEALLSSSIMEESL